MHKAETEAHRVNLLERDALQARKQAETGQDAEWMQGN
jgi:hypothetical protein